MGFSFGVSSDSSSNTEAILSKRTLRDAQWARIERLVAGKKGDRGRAAVDGRLFLDAILWLARTASPWRDLPPELGSWKTAHCRFRRWALAGVWESLFKVLSAEPDFEFVLVDATICKAHADTSGAVEGINQTIRGMVLPRKRGLKLTQLAARRAA